MNFITWIPEPEFVLTWTWIKEQIWTYHLINFNLSHLYNNKKVGVVKFGLYVHNFENC